MAETTVCVDVGGTFVDLALYGDNSLLAVHKVLNDYATPDSAVLRGIQELCAQQGQTVSQIDRVIYSTTLAINAVIQRNGARTALICTEGFRDALEVRGEIPYDLYNPFAPFPEPIVPRGLRLGLVERTLASGEIESAPSEEAIERLAEALKAEQVEAVAICLINSYANAQNEQRVAEVLARLLPEVPLSLSSDVLPEIGEYGRASTTVLNAYLLRIVARHLESISGGLEALGFAGQLHAVTSSGALLHHSTAAQFPIMLLESGPAAGSVGVAAMRPDHVVTFDIGGTTAKTSFVNAGQPLRSAEYEAGRLERFRKGSGLLVRVPTVDIIEIGAGGGSIAAVDRAGILSVGPRSAGSSPGPAAYALGGTHPTLTDADLVLGYVNPKNFLGGTMSLDMGKATQALEKHIGADLGVGAAEAALGVVRTANAHMAQALSVHAAERGINLQHLTMVALGGAGPVHACSVAEAAGVRKVVIPADAGVLSAKGCMAVPRAFDFAGSLRMALDAPDLARLNALIGDLSARAAERALGGSQSSAASIEHQVDLSYDGQRSVLTVPFPCSGAITSATLAEIQSAFEEAYLERYGRLVEGVAITSVTWRVRAVVAAAPSSAAERSAASQSVEAVAAKASSSREVIFEREGACETAIFRREDLAVGMYLVGPAVIEDSSTSIVIPPRAEVSVDASGALSVDLSARFGAQAKSIGQEGLIEATTLGVYWGKMVSIVEEAATTLARTAFSRIVTEARDYSCVLCDAKGRLIAQALQGLPEFVNSLGEAVPQFLQRHPPETLAPGDVLISNDPLICTSQMNDFVLVHPIWHAGKIVAYAANVSHSPDVGGRLLSTDAKEVFEEGTRIPVTHLMRGGQMNAELLAIMKANCRVPDVMIGDLMAQVAANRVTQDLLIEFLRSEGLSSIEALADEIFDRSQAAVERAILGIPEGTHRGSVTMDGLTEPLTICVSLEVAHSPPRIKVDFAGTSPQTGGSLNCYLNYIRAESAYALLTVLQPGTHVNAGSMTRFGITAPDGCLVNASHPAAVGARSLVVQYVVAAIYNALAQIVPTRVLAEPAAPVWPIVISGETDRGKRFVEMIFLNGGLGARPTSDGVLIGFPSPVVSTKVEVFESEMPFVVEESQLIPESAGEGAFRGGAGQSFVIRATSDRPIQVLLRTERLRHAPRGIHGGGDGRVGRVIFNGNALKGKESLVMVKGDVLRLETAGGGGYGPVKDRPEALKLRDRADGRAAPLPTPERSASDLAEV